MRKKIKKILQHGLLGQAGLYQLHTFPIASFLWGFHFESRISFEIFNWLRINLEGLPTWSCKEKNHFLLIKWNVCCFWSDFEKFPRKKNSTDCFEELWKMRLNRQHDGTSKSWMNPMLTQACCRFRKKCDWLKILNYITKRSMKYVVNHDFNILKNMIHSQWEIVTYLKLDHSRDPASILEKNINFPKEIISNTLIEFRTKVSPEPTAG